MLIFKGKRGPPSREALWRAKKRKKEKDATIFLPLCLINVIYAKLIIDIS